MVKKLSSRPRRRQQAQLAAIEPRWERDRLGKESALLDAFDALLQERGAHRVTVNGVVRRARVGKSLLYSYFGGLEGLAAAWAERSELLPSDADLLGGDPAEYARLSTREQLTRNYQRYARSLRARPRTLELLGGELLQETAVTRALDRVRMAHGRSLVRLFSRPEEYDREEIVALQPLLYAAVCYLALRSRTAPRYFGLRLDREADWRRVEAMLEIVIGRVVGGSAAAPRRKRTRRAKS
ncbi:MAG: TetR/AcrR family transcriptional regulator [Proteobacteria bacterium]|nr:TetR/AcrR family transcriptional regulator [Pseudomonadota bacterium]